MSRYIALSHQNRNPVIICTLIIGTLYFSALKNLVLDGAPLVTWSA